MAQTPLANALLRRKELMAKVAQLHPFKKENAFKTKVQRINVAESVDEVTATVPKVTMAKLTEEYDSYASKLRRVDAAIQRANWETMVDIEDDIMENFKVVEEED